MPLKASGFPNNIHFTLTVGDMALYNLWLVILREEKIANGLDFTTPLYDIGGRIEKPQRSHDLRLRS